MGEVRVLPDAVASQIAAGEVVERPASVVKELVENSLDAGARRVEVRAEEGGARLVAVRDDGRAMDAEDARAAFGRHATSKLRAIEDLVALSTYGFRGEALPSIASVARVRLVTCQDPLAGAAEVRVEGGRMVHSGTAAAPLGTEVEVRDLFYNTPARRKYLRSTATELGHVVEAVSAAALARPDVAFTLEHDGKALLRTEGRGELAEAAVNVLGRSARVMLPVDRARQGVRVRGLLFPPEAPAPPARPPFLFVNGRPVRSPAIVRAIAEGYAGTLRPGAAAPPAVLFVELPPALVDVNVHPTKREVRFARPSEVADAVREAVAEALHARAQVPEAARAARPVEGAPGLAAQALAPAPALRPGQVQAVLAPPAQAAAPSGRTGLPVEGLAARPELGGRFARLVYLGELLSTYLMFEGEGELLLVDLHAAAERARYEELRRRHAAGEVAVQELVAPLVLELGPRESVLLEAHSEALGELGLGIEPFGSGAFRVTCVPVLMGRAPDAADVRALVGDVVALGRPAGREAQLDALLKLMACRGSVKAGERLAPEQAEALLRRLLECDEPYTCPHGRPTMVSVTRAQLEREFKRAG